MTGTSIFWLPARFLHQKMHLVGAVAASSSSSSSSSSSTSSHLTREQQVMLNFNEIVALWYFVLMMWYGSFRLRNRNAAAGNIGNGINTSSSSSNSSSSNNSGSGSGNPQHYGFSLIHWLILSIACMGLANFLFSVSLLEALDHTSSIGSKVLKLSYVNMFLACLRHPCTLSLGVLAPKIAFGSDRYYYFPSRSSAGGESIKRTAMCLAALAGTQIVLRMTENLMVMFRYGGARDSETVKLEDFFEFVIDGIFLVWMVCVLYSITMELSRDEYQSRGSFSSSSNNNSSNSHSNNSYSYSRLGPLSRAPWQAWWKSQSLFFVWILYTIFVTVSTSLILIGVSTFLGASFFASEHFVYALWKAHAVNDLLLVTGIAVVLRPKAIAQPQSPFDTGGNSGRGAGGGVGVDVDVDVDYSLLLAEGSSEEEEEPSGGDGLVLYDDGEVESNFEMTVTATT